MYVKVVVLVHLYGTPGKIDEIKKICDKHNAILVEDAAEGLGASYKGRQTGTFGKYNIISFNGNKIITGSSGGMLLTDSKEACDKARKWSTQASVNAEGRPIWKPMHMQPIYRMNPFITKNGNGRAGTNAYIEGESIDIGMDIFNRGLCLPSDNKMTKEEQDKIIEIVKACFE